MYVWRDPRFSEVRNRRRQLQRILDGECRVKVAEKIIGMTSYSRYLKAPIRCRESTLDLRTEQKSEFPYDGSF